MNRVILVGRLTKDPELRTMPSGSAVASFTLAINRNFTNQQGEREADFLAEKMNSLVSKSNNTIEDYFKEWEKAINELSHKEVELTNLKEVYAEKEQEILTNTDFKELYGANNDKVRKNHVKKTLQAMTDAKQDLEISIDYLKRRIDFIKNLMSMQRTLLECGVLE